MMLESIKLPFPDGSISCELVYLAEYRAESGVRPAHLRALGHLHKTKAPAWQGRITDGERRDYEGQIPTLAMEFAEAVPQREYAALLAAPSSRPDLVCPFALAVRQRLPNVPDLTPFIRRTGGRKSGDGASFDELVAATHFEPPSFASPIVGAFLIVDDVFSTGKTAAVIAHLLRKRFGAALIVVACPLRTINTPPTFKGLPLDELQSMMTTDAPAKGKPSAVRVLGESSPALGAISDEEQHKVSIDDVEKVAVRAQVRR